MGLNSTSPTTFTSGVLITDTTNSSGGARGVISSNITPGTALDIQSTLGGIGFPRMTTVQRDAIAVSNGTMIYNTTTDQFNMYQGGAWQIIDSSANLNLTVVGSSRIIDDGAPTGNLFLGITAGNAGGFGLSTGNVGIGSDALSSLSPSFTSDNNIALGARALENLINGDNNIAIGTEALKFCTDGDDNIAIGNTALVVNTGSNNIGIGSDALDSITTGIENVGVGTAVLTNLTASNGNTALGHEAGLAQLSLTNCLFLGKNADANVNNLTNAIAIGAGAIVSQSNSLILGNGTSVGIGTSAPAYTLHVVSAAQAIKVDGGYIGRRVAVAGTTYTALTTDFIIQSTNTNAVTITLPAASASNNGQIYLIKGSSNAGTNNTTIAPASGTIDGAANVVINANYGSKHVFSDGTNWFTI